MIFFFSFVVQIMCYLGAMQWIIMKLGWILQSIMGTTLCESLSAAANPFIGMVILLHCLNSNSFIFSHNISNLDLKLLIYFVFQSESPLMIKPYINKLTSSELHAVLSSGFSTVSGLSHTFHKYKSLTALNSNL